jgi:hypothetical protein
MKNIDHHDLNPLGPNLQHIGGVLFGLTRGTNLIFCIFPRSQGSITNQGMFEMHISLVVGKKFLMHRIIQSHPKLKFGLLFWYMW